MSEDNNNIPDQPNVYTNGYTADPSSKYKKVALWVLISIVVLIIIGAGVAFLRINREQSNQTEVVTEPLKMEVGVLESVDLQQNTITVKFNDKPTSYSVPPSVVISHILNIPKSENPENILSPHEKLAFFNLEEKTGQELYLIFDKNSEQLAEIHLFNKEEVYDKSICENNCGSFNLDKATQFTGGRIYKSFPVTVGTTYNISIQARISEDNQTGSINLTVVSGEVQNPTLCNQASCILTRSIASTSPILTIYLDSSQGDIYIDDLKIVKAEL